MSFYNVNTILRDINLSILGVIIFIAVQFAMLYIYKWYKSPYRTFSDLKFSWALFLITIAISTYIGIIADFYTTGTTRDLYLRLGDASLLFGLAIFANIQERAIPYKTKNFFTIAGIIAPILILMNIELLVSILRDYVMPVLYLTLFILFSIKLTKDIVEPYKLMCKLFLVGSITAIVGYIFVSDYMVEHIGFWFYSVGAMFVLTGLTITSFSISRLPSFDELNWKSKLKEIYFIHESGVPLFHISFDDTKKEDDTAMSDEVLKSGALTSINMVIQSITRSEKKMKMIDQRGIKLLFGYRESLILVILAEENLNIYHYKINQFFEEFFALFKNVPKNIYNRRVFRPARAIAMKIFKEE